MVRLKIGFWLPFLILFGALPAASQPPSSDRGAPPAALVVTEEVTEGLVKAPLTLVGTAEPRHLAEVAAETAGLVASVPGRRGDEVAAGAPLVTLRPVRQQLLLEEARARLRETASRIGKARADAERAEQLFAQNFISREELEERTTQLEALERQADQIRATIRLLEDRLERMVVRAPFAGRIVSEETEIGQWLDEGQSAAVLADLSVIQVIIPVPEQQIGGVEVGDSIGLRFDALPEQEFAGKVTGIVPQADEDARTFPVQIDVANPERRILGGMLARATFTVGAERITPLVPKDALVPQAGGGGHVVRVVEDRADFVPVRILIGKEDRFAVQPLDGELIAGERVVVRGNERLRPGQMVREAPSGGKSRGEKPAP